MRRILAFLLLPACIDFELEGVRDPTEEGLKELAAEPGAIDFGTLASPATVTETVALTSTGDLPVTLASVSVTGSTAYTITTIAADTVVDPAGSLTVVVSYTPATFDDEAQLVVRSDAVEPTLVVPLSGAGIYPAIAVSPSSVSFQSDAGEPVTEEVVVTSVGTADLEISDMLVQGEQFTAEGDIPATLAPGESLTLTTRYTPEVEGETVTGKVWLTTNTPEGFAVVPLTAHNGPVCVGMGEAWDRGLVHPSTLADGLTLRVENLSAEESVCIDRWYVYLSEDSQDMGAGDMDGDVGGDYPAGSIELAPGESVDFAGGALSDGSWWCMEETQYTTRNADYEFLGAHVPEPLLSSMHAGDQDGVWGWMVEHPVMIAARRTNYVELGTGGGAADVSLRIVNMGGAAGAAYVRESVPDGWSASGFSTDPIATEEGEDGATVYVFAVSLDAREETGMYSHTIYDEAVISYTLTVPPCEGRSYAPMLSSSWTDGDGVPRVATANPLVVNCVE